MTRNEALQTAKPILFSTGMVRAIQDNRKTVTRRVIKPRFRENELGFFTATIAGKLFLCYSDEDDNETRRVKAPYQVGDILYVRETWYYESAWDDLETEEPDLPSGRYLRRYVYKADNPDYPVDVGVGTYGWKPSIHMPKEAARIFLRVTGVRVERLQDITDEDMVRDFARCPEAVNAVGKDVLAKTVWNSTVKKSDLDKYGWAANPWVWVIEFERAEVSE